MFLEIFVLAGPGWTGLKPHIFTVQAGEVHWPMLMMLLQKYLCCLRIFFVISYIKIYMGYVCLHQFFKLY
jgi:hypothetical protein